ncbi:preprotein translocase subunit SecA, partial [Staphylococcus aureus]|nr:preprotein translocase subunit SecA [Staphylococcus aureus]
VETLMERLQVPDNQPIDSRMVTKAIKNAQTSVESQNFEIRKNVLKYDDVQNKQRQVIYAARKRILEGEDLQEQVEAMLDEVLEAYVKGATENGYVEDWDLDSLWTALRQLYPVGIDYQDLIDGDEYGQPGD